MRLRAPIDHIHTIEMINNMFGPLKIDLEVHSLKLTHHIVNHSSFDAKLDIMIGWNCICL